MGGRGVRSETTGGTGELAAGDVQMDWLRDGCHGDHGQPPLLHTACFQVSSWLVLILLVGRQEGHLTSDQLKNPVSTVLFFRGFSGPGLD